MKEDKCPTCGGSGWTTCTANSAGVSGLVPCSHGTAPAQPVEELEIADESKDTDIQHHLRNVWHDNFNEAEFIEEMDAYIEALLAREKARYCAEVLEKARRHVGDLHIEWVGSRDGDVVEAREAERRWMATALDTMIAEQTKIAEGGDEGR